MGIGGGVLTIHLVGGMCRPDRTPLHVKLPEEALRGASSCVRERQPAPALCDYSSYYTARQVSVGLPSAAVAWKLAAMVAEVGPSEVSIRIGLGCAASLLSSASLVLPRMRPRAKVGAKGRRRAEVGSGVRRAARRGGGVNEGGGWVGGGGAAQLLEAANALTRYIPRTGYIPLHAPAFVWELYALGMQVC